MVNSLAGVNENYGLTTSSVSEETDVVAVFDLFEPTGILDAKNHGHSGHA
jgi:hypothetical protein